MSVDFVTAVMVSFDTLMVTQRSVDSLLEFYPELKLILIDNHSTDGSWEWIQQLSQAKGSVSSARMPDNLTHGPALHRGVMAVRTPYVLTLDSDIKVLRGGFVELMAQAFEKDPKLFAIGPKGTADVSGTRKGGYPLVHPAVMMMSVVRYRMGRPFRHAGQPVAEAMADARRRNDHMKSFPVWDYVKHYGGATRSVVAGRILRSRMGG